jgi:hypothetical protein
MSVHSHNSVNGRTIRIPHLFEVDDSGDKIVVKGQYNPLDADTSAPPGQN